MKLYRVTQNIGRAKHVVSYHNGEKTHPDGSPFFDIAIFSNKKKRGVFIRGLHNTGYTGS
jgi:hypothetical protein